jgi:glyoxylase-like metal-dependent hydrolase (beta-lactamase superfamily II)
MFGVSGSTAIYLIEDEKKCLIDDGTQTEAKRIINMLKERNVFPPEIVIVTHSHYDHTQAIPAMRKEAAKQGKTIDVMASETAIPLLEDQSYNDVFESGPYKNIRDVTPVKEGDSIDIGQTTLKIFEVPGHHKDHIAILDEMNKNIFVGDSIGYKVGDDTFLPPFMPPFWDAEAFHATIEKLRQINYESLCLAHFGYIYGRRSQSYFR